MKPEELKDSITQLRNTVKEMGMIIYDIAEIDSNGNITNANDIAHAVLEWQAKEADKAKLSQQPAPVSEEVKTAFDRMMLNEQSGGTGWWSGWEALKAAMGVQTEVSHGWNCTKCDQKDIPGTHITYEETHVGCGGICFC